MTPDEFTKFEDEKAILALRKKIEEVIDGKDLYHVMSVLHELYFGIIPYCLKEPKKYLVKLAADCLQKSKTIKPIDEEDL